jgi:hypothetical protein
VLKTQEKPNIQNKIYPLNGNVTVGRNSENPKKHKGKTTGSADQQIQATSQQRNKPNLQPSKKNKKIKS